MALLHVSAIAEDTIAAPGNALSCYIVVSVTDANGAGVTGIVMPFFLVGSPIVAPGGAVSRLVAADPAGAVSGVYILQIQPQGGVNWKAGVYIWSVGVTHGTDHGQALCSVLMD